MGTSIIAFTLLSAGLAGLGQQAQLPGTGFSEQEAFSEVRSQEADHPVRRRILSLADGTILRGRTRCVKGVWETLSPAGWQPLDSPVVRQRLESAALLEARALERSLRGVLTGDARWVEYICWLHRQGLRSEGARAIARALEADPDDPAILKLISGLKLSLELKDPLVNGSRVWQREVVQQGVRGDALERELAARALLDLREQPGFAGFIQSLVQGASAAQRRFGLFLERRVSGGESWRLFARSALLDPAASVRQEAALGMKAFGDGRVLGPMLAGLESEYSIVRRNAAQAMGAMGYPAAVEPLIQRLAALGSSGGGPRSSISVLTQRAVLFDFDVEVAAGASIADPQIVPVTEGVVLDVRVLSSLQVVVSEAPALRSSLAQLTDSQRRNAADWQKWWRANGDQWAMEQHLPRVPSKN